MNKDYGKAFPSELGYGLSKEEWFAAHAPEEIPEWFKHIECDKPVRPTDWYSISNNPNHPFFHYAFELKEWHHGGGEYDLPPSLYQYQNDWTEYWKQMQKWEIVNKMQRYFQWRKYYAVQMCELFL